LESRRSRFIGGRSTQAKRPDLYEALLTEQWHTGGCPPLESRRSRFIGGRSTQAERPDLYDALLIEQWHTG
ncbi:MAG: hypothetical protein JSU86_08435, partial [Phycisphaerales bacterium]